MKKIVTVIFILLAISCKRDNSCETVVCKNGGTCEDGACNCPPGYEGNNCENISNELLLGNYNCHIVGSYSYYYTPSFYAPCDSVNFNFDETFTASIQDDPNNVGRILIDRIWGCELRGYLNSPYEFSGLADLIYPSTSCTWAFCNGSTITGILNGQTITLTNDGHCVSANIEQTHHFTCTMVKQ